MRNRSGMVFVYIYVIVVYVSVRQDRSWRGRRPGTLFDSR